MLVLAILPADPVCRWWQDLPSIFVQGLLGFTLYNRANTGEQTVASEDLPSSIQTTPIWNRLAGHSQFRRQRPAPWGWAGTAISFTEVSFIALQGAGP